MQPSALECVAAWSVGGGRLCHDLTMSVRSIGRVSEHELEEVEDLPRLGEMHAVLNALQGHCSRKTSTGRSHARSRVAESASRRRSPSYRMLALRPPNAPWRRITAPARALTAALVEASPNLTD
jgi:hypothetical protein